MSLSLIWIIVLISLLHADLSVGESNSSSFHKKTNKIIKSGRHFIVGTIEAAPYVIIQESSDGKIIKIDGFVIEILKWIGKRYNFTYEYVKSPDMAFGAFVNGSWNGLVGMIVRGEIDIAATSLTITYSRLSVVDFTLAFLDDPMGLLIPFPKLDSTISGIVKPYQYEVWLGIILSLFIAAIVLWSICQFQSIKTCKNDFKGKTMFFPQFWFLFRSAVNPDNIISFTTVTRIVVTSWCLTTVVLVNTYNSSLVSYLMAPKFLPLISTVEDLADSQDIQLAVLKDTFTYSMLSSATSGVFEKLGDSLKAHPENLLNSLDNLNDIVAFQRKAFVFEQTALRMRVHEDLKATNQCRLNIAKEPFLSDNRLAFALPKHSPLTNIFNNELKQLRQLGLLDHWTESYLPKSDRCIAQLSSSRPPKSNKSLTVNYLSSAFVLYGVGIFISISSFFFELYFQNHKLNSL